MSPRPTFLKALILVGRPPSPKRGKVAQAPSLKGLQVAHCFLHGPRWQDVARQGIRVENPHQKSMFIAFIAGKSTRNGREINCKLLDWNCRNNCYVKKNRKPRSSEPHPPQASAPFHGFHGFHWCHWFRWFRWFRSCGHCCPPGRRPHHLCWARPAACRRAARWPNPPKDLHRKCGRIS